MKCFIYIDTDFFYRKLLQIASDCEIVLTETFTLVFGIDFKYDR